MLGLRLAGMILGVTAILVVLANTFLLRSWDARYAAVVLVILWVALTVIQLYYLSKERNRLGRPRGPAA